MEQQLDAVYPSIHESNGIEISTLYYASLFSTDIR